jgi:hypothetical protein
MQGNRRLFLIFGTVVATVIALITLSSALPLQQNQQATKTNTNTIEENESPIVDFQETPSTDELEQAKRRLKGAKHDKSLWNVDPTDRSDNTVIVDFVDSNLPALPFTKSTTVVVGSITAAKAYLSNDRTGVYSEFLLRVEEVIKTHPQVPVIPGCRLELVREGGRVRFPSGHVHVYKISELEMPHVGARYLFFLTDGNQNESFRILTAYRLQAGKIIPLDDLRQPQIFRNVDETTFLNEVRTKASNN